MGRREETKDNDDDDDGNNLKTTASTSSTSSTSSFSYIRLMDNTQHNTNISQHFGDDDDDNHIDCYGGSSSRRGTHHHHNVEEEEEEGVDHEDEEEYEEVIANDHGGIYHFGPPTQNPISSFFLSNTNYFSRGSRGLPSSSASSSSSSARLSHYNYLNVTAYVAKLLVATLLGVWGLDHLVHSNVDIFSDHQTLLTPAKWSFYIWFVILGFEGIFCVAQLLPEFRSRTVVREGTKFFFGYACAAHIAWIILVSLGCFQLACIAALAALVSLCSLLTSQYISRNREESNREYWFFRFPFSLHLGWFFVMTSLNFCLVLLELGLTVGQQLAMTFLLMAILLLVAFFFLAVLNVPDLVVPSVLVWSYIGIWWEMNPPSQDVLDKFGKVVTTGVAISSLGCAILISCLLVPMIMVRLFRERLTIHVEAL